MMLALSGFIIPFSFACDRALTLAHVILRTSASTLGIVMLGAGLIGYFVAPLRAWERGARLVGALLLIFPGAASDVLGVTCSLAVLVSQRMRRPGDTAARGRKHRSRMTRQVPRAVGRA